MAGHFRKMEEDLAKLIFPKVRKLTTEEPEDVVSWRYGLHSRSSGSRLAGPEFLALGSAGGRRAVMKRMIVVVVSFLTFLAIVVGLGPRGLGKTAAAQASQTPARELPTFQVDPSPQKRLANDWVWSIYDGITVWVQDHVWNIGRPRG